MGTIDRFFFGAILLTFLAVMGVKHGSDAVTVAAVMLLLAFILGRHSKDT